jgi:hypothetical protein
MSQTMQATGEAAAAAAEDKAALAEEGSYAEAAEAAGSSSSGFKHPLLQASVTLCSALPCSCLEGHAVVRHGQHAQLCTSFLYACCPSIICSLLLLLCPA